MNRFCILFAGPIGSGKSYLAKQLAEALNLPIFSNDEIRQQIKDENGGKFDPEKYEQRLKAETEELLQSGKSFVYDASMDRGWSELKPKLKKHNYKHFLISLDYPKDKLAARFLSKGYPDLTHFDRTYADHQKFLLEFGNDLALSHKFEQGIDSILEAIE